jgi:hypothetical protein
MSGLLLEFRRDDAEIEPALLDALGPEAEFIEIDRFEGAVDLVQVAVPLATATIGALAPILIAYFNTRAKERLGRKVTIGPRQLHFEGLSADEIVKVLSESAKGR